MNQNQVSRDAVLAKINELNNNLYKLKLEFENYNKKVEEEDIKIKILLNAHRDNEIQHEQNMNATEMLEFIFNSPEPTPTTRPITHKRYNRRRNVLMLRFDGTIANTFKNCKAASVATGISYKNINQALNDTAKTAGGWKWEYEMEF